MKRRPTPRDPAARTSHNSIQMLRRIRGEVSLMLGRIDDVLAAIETNTAAPADRQSEQAHS